MARSIEHRSSYPVDPATLQKTLVDKDFLRAKLTRLGGTHAKLLDYRVDGETVEFRTTHGVPEGKLPGPVRALMGGELTIERTESWRGDHTGTVRVALPHSPGELTATVRLTATKDGCTQVLDGRIKVGIPLLGGKIEDSVGGHILKLLDAEAEFTKQWLLAA
jgi:hypothetical protein